MSSDTSKWRHFVNFMAYCAVVMVGIALLIALIFKSNSGIAGALSLVANCLAYIIISISAFYYCRSKRNIWFFVVWLVAVVLIVVCVILQAR